MTSNLFPHLVSELERVFDVEPGAATPDTTIEALGLDSLALLELVTRYEDERGVELPEAAEAELGTSSTLADICAVLERAQSPVGKSGPSGEGAHS
ncbi:acyl carrier protein [Streptomyces sp. LP05-1]|uniref:Acyl carrier protein n=1 Tax=Streptomyces pyxinae TaxID=2970734 RepID=A0ABT2CHB3_9ACTN|nr:acyl carrier protein [Streptomyces sp. LP05-1]MCS0636690.1 acyl carrier protein [Streptomyces sp. LP05-1]